MAPFVLGQIRRSVCLGGALVALNEAGNELVSAEYISTVATRYDGGLLVGRVVGVPVGVDADMHTFTGDFGVELGAVNVFTPAQHLHVAKVPGGEDGGPLGQYPYGL